MRLDQQPIGSMQHHKKSERVIRDNLSVDLHVIQFSIFRTVKSQIRQGSFCLAIFRDILCAEMALDEVVHKLWAFQFENQKNKENFYRFPKKPENVFFTSSKTRKFCLFHFRTNGFWVCKENTPTTWTICDENAANKRSI